MNAVEFVKKYGFKHNAVNLKYLPLNQHAELERLVESYELVMEHGSIERAKKYADSPYTAPEIKDVLLKAIRDVEKCQ